MIFSVSPSPPDVQNPFGFFLTREPLPRASSSRPCLSPAGLLTLECPPKLPMRKASSLARDFFSKLEPLPLAASATAEPPFLLSPAPARQTRLVSSSFFSNLAPNLGAKPTKPQASRPERRIDTLAVSADNATLNFSCRNCQTNRNGLTKLFSTPHPPPR